MANHRTRGIKSQGGLGGIFEFINKNWQGFAIVLGIIAIIIWYQALGLGTLFNSDQELASLGRDTESVGEEEIEEGAQPEAEQESELATSESPSDQETIAQLPEPQPAPPPQEPPKPAVTGEEITGTANPGQGVTHLAREALDSYLQSKKPDVTLTREHKIYIEDYLKDQVGSRSLEVGEELTFTFDSIKTAIDLSQQLSESQLSRLTPYAQRVPSLQAYMPSQ